MGQEGNWGSDVHADETTDAGEDVKCTLLKSSDSHYVMDKTSKSPASVLTEAGDLLLLLFL